MHTGARARKQKYISIYISLYMKTFLKTGVYIYIYIYIYNFFSPAQFLGRIVAIYQFHLVQHYSFITFKLTNAVFTLKRLH